MGGTLENDAVGNTLHLNVALQVISVAANGTFRASSLSMQISDAGTALQRLHAHVASVRPRGLGGAGTASEPRGRGERADQSLPTPTFWGRMAPASKGFLCIQFPGGDPPSRLPAPDPWSLGLGAQCSGPGSRSTTVPSASCHPLPCAMGSAAGSQ